LTKHGYLLRFTDMRVFPSLGVTGFCFNMYILFYLFNFLIYLPGLCIPTTWHLYICSSDHCNCSFCFSGCREYKGQI